MAVIQAANVHVHCCGFYTATSTCVITPILCAAGNKRIGVKIFLAGISNDKI